MKIQIAKVFRTNQRGMIRAAIVVAAENFPMPSRVIVNALPRDQYDPEYTDEPLEGLAFPGRMFVSPALTDAALFFTVSHEARHLSDMHTGKLAEENGKIFWNGRKVDGRTAYRKLPYEKPAFAYEKRLGFAKIRK